MDDKSHLKGAWSGSRESQNYNGSRDVTHCNFVAPDDISGTAKVRVIKFYITGRLYNILAYVWQTTPKKSVVA